MTWTGVVRWGVRGFGALLVLVLAWVLFGRLYTVRRLDAAREAFKRNVGPIELSAWVSPPVPDEENAAIPIRSGAVGLVLGDADRTLIGELTRKPTETMTAEQMSGLRQILEGNRTALEMIAKGARLERSTFGEELRLDVPRLEASGRPRLDALAKSPLVGVMYVARVLRAKARLERVEGDREQMQATLETVFGLARAVYQEPRTMSLIIGNAVERIGLGEVTAVATEKDASVAELQRMQAMLLANDLRSTWRRVQAAEALMLLAGVERAVSGSSSRLDPSPWERSLSAVWGPVPEAVQLELCTEFVKLIDAPAALYGPIPELPKGIAGLRWRLVGFVNPFGVTKNVFRTIFTKETRNSVGRLQATMTQRTLVRLVLALRLQGLTSGAYPHDLSGFPEAAGPDPFTGKLLAYEHKADGSAVVAIPDGEELWKQVTGGMPTPCPFSVTLPPPGKPTARGAA